MCLGRQNLRVAFGKLENGAVVGTAAIHRWSIAASCIQGSSLQRDLDVAAKGNQQMKDVRTAPPETSKASRLDQLIL